MMMGYGYGMNFLGMLVCLAVIVGVIYLVVKLLTSNDSGRKYERRASQTLADRYARGEITEDEYSRMKEVLRK